MSTPHAAAKAAKPMTLGVDLGAATTRIALLDPAKPMPTIIRNELSNEATSTVVAYPENEARCFGENAASKQITKPAETVIDLAEWLFGSSKNNTCECPGRQAGVSEGEDLCLRQIGTEKRHPVQVTAYFIKSVLGFVPGNIGEYPVCVSIPTAASDEAAIALRLACVLAGIPKEHVRVAPSDEAMAAYYHHMQYTQLSEENESHVLILDVGQSCVSACILGVTKHTMKKLAVQSLRMGSGFIDGALCSHVYGEISKKFGESTLQGDAKSFRRIVRECRKAKEILSTVEETKIQLEALQGHMDISVPISRAKLEELAHPFMNELRGMLTALKASLPPPAEGEASPVRVEMIGGGWRTTFVSNLVREVLEVQRLGVSLDANLAVAEGSAILAQVCSPLAASFEREDEEEAAAAKQPEDGACAVHPSHKLTLIDFAVTTPHSPTSRPLSEQDESVIAAWAEAESGLAATDTAIRARLAAINRLDSFVLQSLQTMDASAATTDRKQEARTYLTSLDKYVQDDCNGDATEAITAKLAEVETHVAQEFPEIQQQLDKVQAEQKRKEEELTKLSKEQQEEEKELKTDPQRLRGAQKRREQGTNLFKQEHWQEAQTRFVQALAILGQLYDVSSEETRKTRDEIALSCHLNIASCSVKLGLWRNAINNCTSALELSPQHPKAFFRRGQAYAANKDYKEAVRDLEQAAKLSSNDAAVVAELSAAKANLESQKAKEKKMFAKMFS